MGTNLGILITVIFGERMFSNRKWMDASVPLLVIPLLVLCLQIATSNGDSYMETLADRMTSRGGDHRLHIWHSDCFSRCGGQLTRAMELACRYDPYRIHRRSRRSIKMVKIVKEEKEDNSLSARSLKNTPVKDTEVFYTKRLASSFLRRGSSKAMALKRKKRGITEECCFNACAWEEYAEFCPAHLRSRNRQTTVCL